MIFRTVKNSNYVCIHKGFLEDTELSFKAKGLMSYFLSRKDDWEFHVSHIQKVSTDGRDAVYTGINELIENGYIVRKTIREKGKFEKVVYFIYETTQLNSFPKKHCEEGPITENPYVENPYAEKPVTEKPPLVSNEYIISNEKSNNPLTPKPGEPASADGGGVSSSSKKKSNLPKTEVAPSVLLTQLELSSLNDQYGLAPAKEMLTILSNYKLSSGKNYKSDYHAIISWVKDRYLEKRSGSALKGKMSLPNDGKIDPPDAEWRKKRL